MSARPADLPPEGVAPHPGTGDVHRPRAPAAAGAQPSASGRTVPAAEEASAASPRVVVLTTFFPSPRDPHRTPFVPNLLRELAAGGELDLVVPVPRRPPLGSWRDAVPVPPHEDHAGFALVHPRYLAIPGLHWLSGLTYFLGVRRVLRELQARRGSFVLHAHCAYPDAVGAALIARSLRVPLVVTVHGSDINVSALHPMLRPQIRWALRGARRVVAVSAALQDKVVALTGLPPARVLCIPCSGHAPELFRPRDASARAALRQRLGIASASRVAVFVGHLEPVKGVDILLRAWARVGRNDAAGGARRLVLIGQGPDRQALERLAEAEGVVEFVTFLGPLPQPVVADWIAASDALCLASRSEGSPNVVVEALASGTPVVATRVGGVPDLVEDGVNGRLVPPGDPVALAQALVDVLGATWDPVAIAGSVGHLTWRVLAERNRSALTAAEQEGP